MGFLMSVKAFAGFWVSIPYSRGGQPFCPLPLKEPSAGCNIYFLNIALLTDYVTEEMVFVKLTSIVLHFLQQYSCSGMLVLLAFHEPGR